jgi:coenzyme F420 hydrogenase subunit beta
MGIPLTDNSKVNINSKFIVWRRSTGERVEIPLKESHPYWRERCKRCRDLAAEHANISTGGLGQSDGWTLTIVRTERGAEWLRELQEANWIEVRPGSDDPAALELINKLAAKQRRRWNVTGDGAAAPRAIPAEYEPKPKA